MQSNRVVIVGAGVAGLARPIERVVSDLPAAETRGGREAVRMAKA